MKLLIDEQLSPRLARSLQAEFPGSLHVHDLGLGGAEDRTVFEHARMHGLMIVTKDSDFADLVFSLGSPPKIVWLRLGNCTTATALELVRGNAPMIREFADHPVASLLALSDGCSE